MENEIRFLKILCKNEIFIPLNLSQIPLHVNAKKEVLWRHWWKCSVTLYHVIAAGTYRNLIPLLRNLEEVVYLPLYSPLKKYRKGSM
jgi:hypothetical protein